MLQEAKDSIQIKPFRVTAVVVLMCILCAVIISIICWIASSSWEAGVACAIILVNLFLLFFVVARVTLISDSKRLRKVGTVMTNMIYRFIWFLQLVYCIPPSLHEKRPSLPVRLIMVNLSRNVLVGDNAMTSLVNFVRELNDSIEEEIGIVIPRLFRIFQAGPYRAPANGGSLLPSKWKKSCCCVPSFLVSVVVLACLIVGLVLYGTWKLGGPSAAIAIQIACLCVIGGFLLANLLRFFIIIYCLVLPMKKRVNFVSTQAGIQEETFYSVVKQELDLCVDMLDSLDGFAHQQTRVVVHIDLLGSLEQQKVLTLIDHLNMMISSQGQPFIFLLSVDPRLLIKAMDQHLSIVQGPFTSPREFLKNLVDLPFYTCEAPKTRFDGLIPLELRRALEEQQISDNEESELEWDDNADVNGDNLAVPCFQKREGHSKVIANGNGHLPNGNGMTSRTRSVKFPIDEEDDHETRKKSISEDISHMIRTNLNGSLNDIKRVMNIIALKGRILTSAKVSFEWPRLAVWINMCDVWPHKASWIIILSMDVSLSLPDKMSVRKLYNLLGYAMPMVGEGEESTTNSNNYFDTFLASQKPVINVGDVRMFLPYLFYLDPTICKLMMDYMIALKSGTISKNPSIHNQLSSRSNFAISPSESSKVNRYFFSCYALQFFWSHFPRVFLFFKITNNFIIISVLQFIWRGGLEEQGFLKMTPEDVVNQVMSFFFISLRNISSNNSEHSNFSISQQKEMSSKLETQAQDGFKELVPTKNLIMTDGVSELQAR